MPSKRHNKKRHTNTNQDKSKPKGPPDKVAREEARLEKDRIKLEHDDVRYKRMKKAMSTCFLLLRAAGIGLLALVGTCLVVAMIVCAIWIPGKTADLVMAFQVLTGVASLFVGIWALVLSIRAERSSALSSGRWYAINYSQIPADLTPQQGNPDVNED